MTITYSMDPMCCKCSEKRCSKGPRFFDACAGFIRSGMPIFVDAGMGLKLK